MYLKFRSTGRKTPLKNWRIKIVYSFSGIYLGLFFSGQHVRWLFSVLGLFWKMVLVSWFDAVWYYRVLSFCILVGTCQTGTFFFPNPNFSSWKWIFFSKTVMIVIFFHYGFHFFSISLLISSSKMHLLLFTMPDNRRKMLKTMKKPCIDLRLLIYL